MDFLQATILGLVEGITEFLPISSTAHLILAEKWLGLASTEFVKTFTISIQLGAILSVIILYWQKITSDILIWKKVLTAWLPTAIIGFVLYQLIKSFLMDNLTIIAWVLLLGGLILIIFEMINKNNRKLQGVTDFTKISYSQAIIIGLAQALAVVPGVSRSAATIVGGLLLGINRQTIVAFSFLLAVPTMLAATVYDIYQQGASLGGENIGAWLIGFIVSFIVATVAIKFLIRFVEKHTFMAFGIYRIILALLIFWWWL